MKRLIFNAFLLQNTFNLSENLNFTNNKNFRCTLFFLFFLGLSPFCLNDSGTLAALTLQVGSQHDLRIFNVTNLLFQ